MGWTVRGSNPVQTGPGAHPASCMMSNGSFPGVKSSWGVTLTPHPLLVLWSTPPMGHMACTEPQCLYSTAIPLLPVWAIWPVQSLSSCTVQLYLYSPYGPYGLYRASAAVQGCTLIYIWLFITHIIFSDQ